MGLQRIWVNQERRQTELAAHQEKIKLMRAMFRGDLEPILGIEERMPSNSGTQHGWPHARNVHCNDGSGHRIALHAPRQVAGPLKRKTKTQQKPASEHQMLLLETKNHDKSADRSHCRERELF
eukprot:5768031-Prymnesium_polylepis.1